MKINLLAASVLSLSFALTSVAFAANPAHGPSAGTAPTSGHASASNSTMQLPGSTVSINQSKKDNHKKVAWVIGGLTTAAFVMAIHHNGNSFGTTGTVGAP